MFYKTLAGRLARYGWKIIDESHESTPNEPGRLIPHYFKYAHPADTSRDNRHIIEITTESNKDGTPGKIRQLWQGGKPCKAINQYFEETSEEE